MTTFRIFFRKPNGETVSVDQQGDSPMEARNAAVKQVKSEGAENWRVAKVKVAKQPSADDMATSDGLGLQ